MLKRVKVFDIAFWNVITNNGSTGILDINKGIYMCVCVYVIRYIWREFSTFFFLMETYE